MILLNPIERKLLTAEGQLLKQRMGAAQRVADQAQAAWDDAVSAVVKGHPMRERPPEKCHPLYDEAQGALVWDGATKTEDAPVPSTEDACTPETVEA